MTSEQPPPPRNLVPPTADEHGQGSTIPPPIGPVARGPGAVAATTIKATAKPGGTVNIGGQPVIQNYHYDGLTRDPIAASREATRLGVTLGRLVPGWDPNRLGVHASITVHDETTLTPYLARAHDHQLRAHLAQAKGSDRPTLVLVVGTSCAGKTRTLYEAIRAVLPDWQLTAPGNDTALATLLLNGIPAKTVVWLDELQDRITRTPDGVTAAKAITALLSAEDVGPIVFAGTIWPTNLTALQDRPDPAGRWRRDWRHPRPPQGRGRRRGSRRVHRRRTRRRGSHP